MNYKQHRNRAAIVRGMVINEIIFLERIMDIYTAQYFCSDTSKLREMIYLFLGNERMTYAGKKQIFYQILKKQNPEIVKLLPDMDDKLDQLGKERNLLAHLVLTNPYPGIIGDKTTVYFSQLLNKHKSVKFDKERFTKLLSDIDKIIKLIQPLLVQPPQE